MLLCAHRSVQEELDRLSQSQSAASVHDRVNKLATRLLDAERTRDELAHKVEECVCPRCKHVLLSPSDRMRACAGVLRALSPSKWPNRASYICTSPQYYGATRAVASLDEATACRRHACRSRSGHETGGSSALD